MCSIRHLLCAAACVLVHSLALASDGPDGTDLFADAPVLEGTNVRAGADVRGFTREPNEPVLDQLSSDHTAWWKWTPAASGYCIVESALSVSTPTVTEVSLAVFTGNNLGELVRQGDSSRLTDTMTVTRVIFFAKAGVEYRIAAASYAFGDPGYLDIHLRQIVPVNARWEGPWANDIPDGGTGYLSVTTTAGGTLSGKLTVNGQVFPFKGPWSIDGKFVASFRLRSPAGTPPLPLATLTLNLTEDEGSLRFKVDTGRRVQEALAFRRAVLPSSGPAMYSGSYTIAFGIDGFGYGGVALSVKKNGAARAVGALLDGTPVSFGGWLSHYSEEGTFAIPFYRSLFKNAGAFLGELAVARDGSIATGLGAVYLRPPAPGKAFLPDGIATGVYFAGMRYIPPARGTRAAGFLDASSGAGKLVLSAVPNEIGNVSEPLTFTVGNKFEFQNKLPRKPSLKLNTRNGLLTGSITEPSGQRRKLFGVLTNLETGLSVIGHASGMTNTVPLTVTP